MICLTFALYEWIVNLFIDIGEEKIGELPENLIILQNHFSWSLDSTCDIKDFSGLSPSYEAEVQSQDYWNKDLRFIVNNSFP